ncbi:MAG: AAA family ATPase [Saprospiraceae bacterium]|nr:AAA family ATPase [Saprospiraceae bacterium]
MYKKGLVFGKYMPIHKGHLALIDFAAQQCERLVVSMSFTPHDPIAPSVRQAWLTQIFADRPQIELAFELDDFHDEGLPLFEATKLWATFIKRRFPDVETFFCSEDYGAPLSFHLGLPCILFDKPRSAVPISATRIRSAPLRYWDFIPSVVQPYFVKKVCLFGPESTGKTTLAQDLAHYFDTEWVHEVARDILTNNDFGIDEIIHIGKTQTELLKHKTLTANKLLFCDTDVITTQIYSKHYLHTVPEVLFDLEKEVQYDLYCLLDIDTPWIADDLRDLGDRRQEMYACFQAALEERRIPYLKVSGDWAQRKAQVVEAVEKWL